MAAIYHCDKHVCKMILESGQMLSTAHWALWLDKLGKNRSDFRLVRDMKSYLKDNVPKDKQPPWSLTHMNHPCSVWTRETVCNYCWHLRLMRGLLDQYTYRYKKQHAAERVYKWLLKNTPPNISSNMLTQQPVCMPDDCKVSDNIVECYRAYYKKHKRRFAKWKKNIPEWWSTDVNLEQP